MYATATCLVVGVTQECCDDVEQLRQVSAGGNAEE